MDVYLLKLSGQGDTIITLVDKPMWDWIMSKDPSIIPPDILKQIQEFGNMSDVNEDHTPHITRGSANNDAALQAAPLLIDGKWCTFFKLGAAMKFIKEHNINIVDEWSGYIY